MNRKTIIGAATAGLVSLSALTGSAAFAATNGNSSDAAELQQFLASNPAYAKVITGVEAKTGGKVTGLAHEGDNTTNAKTLEVEVTMADGTRQDYAVNPADGSMNAVASNNDKEKTEQGTDTENGNDNGGENGADNENDGGADNNNN